MSSSLDSIFTARVQWSLARVRSRSNPSSGFVPGSTLLLLQLLLHQYSPSTLLPPNTHRHQLRLPLFIFTNLLFYFLFFLLYIKIIITSKRKTKLKLIFGFSLWNIHDRFQLIAPTNTHKPSAVASFPLCNSSGMNIQPTVTFFLWHHGVQKWLRGLVI